MHGPLLLRAYAPPPSRPAAADDALSEQLAGKGYTLVCASHAADLASGCPAYFVALRWEAPYVAASCVFQVCSTLLDPCPTPPGAPPRSEERREVVLAIRGTFSPEDAFVDLLATGGAAFAKAGVKQILDSGHPPPPLFPGSPLPPVPGRPPTCPESI